MTPSVRRSILLKKELISEFTYAVTEEGQCNFVELMYEFKPWTLEGFGYSKLVKGEMRFDVKFDTYLIFPTKITGFNPKNACITVGKTCFYLDVKAIRTTQFHSGEIFQVTNMISSWNPELVNESLENLNQFCNEFIRTI